MGNRKLKAEITVFLSLIMVLIFAFVGALIQSSSIQLSKYYKRGDMDIAMNSVFAEYQGNLLEEYGIFSLDGSYETGTYEDKNVLERLEFYGVSDSDLEISRLQLLSDNNGAAFYQQISYYIENKYGLDVFEGYGAKTEIWEEQVEQGEEFEQQKEQQNKSLSKIEQNPEFEEQMPEIINMQPSQLLKLAIPSGMVLSNQQIETANVASHRQLAHGYGTFQMESNTGVTKKLILGEYALDQFRCASLSNEIEENVEESPLLYEIEYLLKGKQTDYENLQGVVYDLFLIRSATNYLCLYQSPTKQSEVEALALTLATLVLQPELEPAITQALLLAWSCGESIMDIRNLLSGGKVKLVKTDADWQLSFLELFTIGVSHNVEVRREVEDGLSYLDYLRMLIYLEAEDTLIMRMLDLIELNINRRDSDANFKVDNCINKMEISCVSTVMGGYTYEFPTYYEYQ